MPGGTDAVGSVFDITCASSTTALASSATVGVGSSRSFGIIFKVLRRWAVQSVAVKKSSQTSRRSLSERDDARRKSNAVPAANLTRHGQP
ncbi:hypothetical protein [Variovorax sp. WS11]|uniref:hypothetical protein n=1 Tax=Variovorax sp. WS11 TaxID=1105204 RepID=UPI0035BFF7F9